MKSSLIALLNYPPLSGQLMFGLNVWIIRILSLVISVILIWYFTKGWRRFILLISPIYWVLWYSYPLILAELIVWILLINLIKKNKWWITVLILVIMVRIGLQGGNINLIDKISPKHLSEQVHWRFVSEDSLTVRPIFSLIFRRISYNKPFFAVKDILQNAVTFFDVETVFYGEFHPLEQKGVPIYFWFETFLLVIGIYFIFRKKKKSDMDLFLIFSFIYFMVSKESSFLRFGLLWFTLSYPIAVALSRVNNFWRNIFVLVLVYSFGINFFNFVYRTDYWFDNKPLVFDFCYKNLPEKEKVYVTQVLGNEKRYCKYYWGKECNLNSNIAGSKYVCIFAGELIKNDFKNLLDPEWQRIWSDRGYKVLKYVKLRDSVAYGFSNYLVIGEKL